MSLTELNKEFAAVLREILYMSTKIDNTYDRVRMLQWLRTLRRLNDKELEVVRVRNDYIHYLRIILNSDPILFYTPFKDEPPADDELPPLSEVLLNKMTERCPDLPRTGPLQPIMCHKTEDGRAFMTVKRCPDGGIFCYLAVAPHNLITE